MLKTSSYFLFNSIVLFKRYSNGRGCTIGKNSFYGRLPSDIKLNGGAVLGVRRIYLFREKIH